MKKNFFLVITALFLTLNANAQDNVKKAEKILKATSKKYKQLKSLKATFTATFEDPQSGGTKTTESGTVYTKGKAFKVELSDEEIVCDGDTMWNYQKGICEVQKTIYKPNKKQISPSNIFTSYDEGYDYTWVGQVTEGGVTLEEIDLVPKDKTTDFSKIKLKVNNAKNEIVSAWIRKKNGMTITYTVKTFTSNPTLAKNFFKFDEAAIKKKGCEIIDLTKKPAPKPKPQK